VSPASTRSQRVLVVYGTRPEAIKMAPVVAALRETAGVDPLVCTTAQHREMVDQVQELFGLVPDIDLDIMTPDQELNDLAARVIGAVDGVLHDLEPDWLLVQGDTTTAMGAALAAFHRGVPVGHVEAGLRTGDLAHPFPEEANRRLIDVLAEARFAPTARARDALLAEGVDPGQVFLTGNTVVDALQSVAGSIGPVARTDEVLITLHRRESFGDALRGVFEAIVTLADRFADVQWVYPVHRNPNVRGPAEEVLGSSPNIQLHDPFDYPTMVRHLMGARLVLTDSGGIQEEAPTFATPVLVARETTERREGVDAGVARLVGLEPGHIVAEVTEVLTDPQVHEAMATAVNPYGDGHAATRIAAILSGAPWEPW
jgi:UDP-N-acetylglucosamine 2-epimerase (non-hydrolysing)